MFALMGILTLAFAGLAFGPGPGLFPGDGRGGSRGDDMDHLGDDDDVFAALAGNDLIDAGEGEDLLAGGPGEDELHGGPGDDLLFGGEGDDVLLGHVDDDTILGMTGNDEIIGGDGDDTLFGGPGDDTIQGSFGDDTLFGGAGSDGLFGGDGDDVIDGTRDEAGAETADFLNGGADDDWILGGMGDTLHGGSGFDTFATEAANAPIVVQDFTRGEDTLVILYDGEEEPEISLEEDTFGLIVRANGEVVATLAGLTAADLGPVELVAT